MLKSLPMKLKCKYLYKKKYIFKQLSLMICPKYFKKYCTNHKHVNRNTENSLSINASKCKLLSISRGNNPIEFEYKIDNIIERVSYK